MEKKTKRPFSRLLAIVGLFVATSAAPKLKASEVKDVKNILPVSKVATIAVDKYAHIDQQEFEENANAVAKNVHGATSKWRSAFRFVGNATGKILHLPGQAINKTLDVPADLLRKIPGVGKYPAYLLDATGNLADYLVGDIAKTGSNIISGAGNLTGGLVDTTAYALTGEMKYAGKSLVGTVSQAVSMTSDVADVVVTAHTGISPKSVILSAGGEIIDEGFSLYTTGDHSKFLKTVFLKDQAAVATAQETELQQAKDELKKFEAAQQTPQDKASIKDTLKQSETGLYKTLDDLSQQPVAEQENTQKTKEAPSKANKELSNAQKIALSQNNNPSV